jgi:hypothetical protein
MESINGMAYFFIILLEERDERDYCSSSKSA